MVRSQCCQTYYVTLVTEAAAEAAAEIAAEAAAEASADTVMLLTLY